MDDRKEFSCSRGYWTGEVESDAAVRVGKVPEVLVSSVMAEEPPLSIREDDISYQVYLCANQVVKWLFDPEGKVDYPIDRVQMHKVCVLILNSKDKSATTSCDLYHVTCKDKAEMHFLILADSKRVLAYVRVHEKNKYSFLRSVYGEQPIVTIEAIQARVRDNYAYGTILAQLAFEYSLNHGYNGRVGLYSVDSSDPVPPAGQFFHKMGFTPLDSHILLHLNGGNDLVGKHMFYTDAAIDAWVERVNQKAILHHQPFSLLSNKNTSGEFVLTSATVFAKPPVTTNTSETGTRPNASLKK